MFFHPHHYIKIFRKHKRITQHEIARLLELNVSTISKYERKKRGIPKDVLETYHSIFDTSLEENKVSLDPKKTYRILQRIKAVLRSLEQTEYSKINEEKKAFLLKTYERLASTKICLKTK